jgi:CBS domain-containing protein
MQAVRTRPEQRAEAVEASPLASARSWSPEAEIGMRVEDIWGSLDVDQQQQQLSHRDKLNSCFDSIPVASFPHAFDGAQLVEIPSDATLAEAVDILSRNRIISAPVWNVDAPEDASWIDRYIGIVEFAGIAVWLLHQSEAAATKADVGADELAAKLGTVTLEGAAAAAANVREPKTAESEGAIAEVFGALPSSDLFNKTKVGFCLSQGYVGLGVRDQWPSISSSTLHYRWLLDRSPWQVKDISGSFRWAPFLALQSSDTFLTMLLLLSKYRMKSLPVVDIGEGTISNVITQGAVVHMLSECVGLHWFEEWGTKTLSEIGLPIMRLSKIVKVHINSVQRPCFPTGDRS